MHVHIRRFDIGREVPIGDVSHLGNANGLSKGYQQPDIPEQERDEFDLWVRDRWREKDDFLEHYLKTGSFVDQPEKTVKVPLKLRRSRDISHAFCDFLPVLAGWLYWKAIW